MVAQVLRLAQTGSSNKHVLLHISRSGRSSLDLKLIGTDHEQLFHASITESNANLLQADKFTGDLAQWKTLLKYVLLHEQPKADLGDLLEGLETVAEIKGSKLTVTIRKNIGGITQRLGCIRLDEDTEREEVSGFDWADVAVANSDALRAQLDALQKIVSQRDADVGKLNKQLDELVKAKKDHEDELLQKCAALLNEKKLKNRDQQRLLNGAQVDPEVAKDVRASRDGTSRRPGASRAGKRRANGAAAEVEAQDDDDEEDSVAPHGEDTPPPSDQETETEDEDGFDQAPAPSASARRNSPPVKQREPSSMDVDEPEELPPRRELPFGQPSRQTRQTSKQPASQPPATKPTADYDDEEETDDEL